MIKVIRSGMQTGVDEIAVKTAKRMGIKTKGIMPKGFLSHSGNHPEYEELYNIQEHESDKYQSRTYENVKSSDGTLRIATHWGSAGEICTLNAIQQYGKPYMDVKIGETKPEDVVKWIKDNNIEILNVAGNSEKTSPGIGAYTEKFLEEVLKYFIEQDRMV